MNIQITNIDNGAGNDLTTTMAMRYRLAADPDTDASYTPVTLTKTQLGVTYPFFDAAAMPTGIYVVHTYVISEGTATGSKITIDILHDAIPA